MNHYLNFTLKGKQLLPVWVAFFFFFMIPYYLLLGELTQITANEVSPQGPSKMFFLYLFFVLTMAFAFVYYISKLVLQSIEIKDIPLSCRYPLQKYIGIIVSGLVLSIVTVGIYIPWFIKNLHRYFIHGTSYRGHKLIFKGQGRQLFLIMTLTIFVPFLIIGIILFSILKSDIDLMIYQLIVTFSMIPYIYLTYRWMFNVEYKAYTIGWDTEFFPAIGKIALELLLAVVTFGIYFPMTYLKLYQYFIGHTHSNVVEGKQIRMGFDLHASQDFLYVWGQTLLTVITLGIYYPWAFSRIAHRILTQTYVREELV